MSLINQVLLDLEKRHASESELHSLPPFVRAVPERPRSSVRMFVLAAIVAAVFIAVAVVVYNSHRAPDVEGQYDVVKPPAVPSPVAAPIAKQSVVAPPAEPPSQAPAFNPVSRISDELSLVPSPQARKEKPAGRSARADIARLLPEPVPASPAPAPLRAEKPQSPATEVASRVETPVKPPAPVAEPVIPPPPAPVAAAQSTPTSIDKQMRELTPQEGAETAFRKGAAQLQDGRANAAEMEFREALKLDPSHVGARQALLGLLLDNGRNNEAEQVVRKALEINPRQPRHAMVLARLEVERGEVSAAINTMVGALPYVQSDPDFHAFLAALLQREGRHREAVDYYRVALRGVPGNGVWMMGLGISLRAANQSAEARDAFQRAVESKQLAPELQEFAEKQLRELSGSKKK